MLEMPSAQSVMPSLRQSPAQKEILDGCLLTSGFSCVLQMPTGSGKTWLAEQAIAHVLENPYRRAIYLTPLKALADELLPRWQERFAPSPVGIFTGDYANGNYPIPFQAARLMIMTPERLDACTRNWRSYWSWIPAVDLVVVDELHLLGDANRGARLEGMMLRLQRLNPFVRFLGLSATLGNRQELADWMGGVEYVSHQRPVPLEWQVVRYKKAQEKIDLLLQVIQPNLAIGGKSLVFVQSRRRAEVLANALQELKLKVAYHHAGVERHHRQSIECQFRAGEIDILIATATLEMGLNLPVRQVVLYDLQGFDGVEFSPLPVNNVWQRAGRAGRQGLDDSGQVVLLAPTWAENPEYYAKGYFEPVRSGLRSAAALAEQIIAEVACGLCRNVEHLKSVFARSLAARQNQLADVQQVVTDMIAAGMLWEGVGDEAGYLRPTKLGYIATRHMVSPQTVLLFKQGLEQYLDLTFLDLLMLAVASEDCSLLIPVDFEQLGELSDYLSQESSILLGLRANELEEILQSRGQRLLAIMHTALIARSWTRWGNVEPVAKDWGCYVTEVSSLRELLQRLLLVMQQVSCDLADVVNVVNQDEPNVGLSERIQVLGKMIQTGLDDCAVTLTLVEGIGATYAHRLKQVGIGDIEDLALAEVAAIAKVPGISAKRAEKWIEAAVSLEGKQLSAYRYREEVEQQKIGNAVFPSRIDPYRLRRALDLRIVGREGMNYRVIGGTDPHTVKVLADRIVCDCADYQKGNLCKHILAVQLHRRCPEICDLADSIVQSSDQTIDLLQLWMGEA